MQRDDERVWISIKVSVCAFLVSFVAFNIAYYLWAGWRYPSDISIAGLTVFIIGLPVGFIAAAIGFIVTHGYTRPRLSS